MHEVEIRRIAADEWQSLRALRLEALQDSPRSYGSTHAGEVRHPDSVWQERASSGAAGIDEVAVVAVAEGQWVGMARGYLELPVAHLIAVYVTPAWRGRGIGQAASRAAVARARERGATEILLSVSDWNEGARRVYQGIGFTPNGVRSSLPWDPSVTESEMRLELG
ncbi:MAG: GNAT family N-acetyltransferase [Chloroflexota bacterium]